MIDRLIEAEARRLLAQGEPKQAIARRLHLSRGTVLAIAKRPPRESEPEKPGEPTSFGRCDDCGNLVWHPCRICAARRERAQAARIPALLRRARENVQVAVDLRPDHHERYLEIRQRRDQSAAESVAPQNDEAP